MYDILTVFIVKPTVPAGPAPGIGDSDNGGVNTDDGQSVATNVNSQSVIDAICVTVSKRLHNVKEWQQLMPNTIIDEVKIQTRNSLKLQSVSKFCSRILTRSGVLES